MKYVPHAGYTEANITSWEEGRQQEWAGRRKEWKERRKEGEGRKKGKNELICYKFVQVCIGKMK